jgi:hypothetical protein
MSFDFGHCLQQDFKFYGIVAGADIDKETKNISVNQIAGKDDITKILSTLICPTLLELRC